MWYLVTFSQLEGPYGMVDPAKHVIAVKGDENGPFGWRCPEHGKGCNLVGWEEA